MPRYQTLTILPSISVDRSALAGSVMAAAGELGASLGDLSQRACGPRPIGDYVLRHLTLAPFEDGSCLGIAVNGPDGTLAIERHTDGRCAVVGLDDNRAAAVVFGECLVRQLVLRRILSVFRTWGFAVVQRSTAPSGAVVLRTRLPLSHQYQPSARTAQPEFAVEIAVDGVVTVHLAGLHLRGRQFVEETLQRALGETADAPVQTIHPDVHAA